MKASKRARRLLDEARKTEEYWIERLSLEYVDEILSKMDKEGISKADMARALDTSPPNVSKILRQEGKNFTLETIVKCAWVLGYVPCIGLEPKSIAMRDWYSCIVDPIPFYRDSSVLPVLNRKSVVNEDWSDRIEGSVTQECLWEKDGEYAGFSAQAS